MTGISHVAEHVFDIPFFPSRLFQGVDIILQQRFPFFAIAALHRRKGNHHDDTKNSRRILQPTNAACQNFASPGIWQSLRYGTNHVVDVSFGATQSVPCRSTGQVRRYLATTAAVPIL
jgi:hypothetical protein